jgi:hypothetical protein
MSPTRFYVFVIGHRGVMVELTLSVFHLVITKAITTTAANKASKKYHSNIVIGSVQCKRYTARSIVRFALKD